MKYFVTNVQRKGTCYQEFSMGIWNDTDCWKEDSIFIYADLFDALGFGNLFLKCLPKYNYHGPNVITSAQWKLIYEEAYASGGKLYEAILEMEPWVENNFKTADVFMLLGI